MSRGVELRKVPWHLRYRTLAMLASRLRKLQVVLTHQHCHVEFQGPVYLGPGFQLEIPGSGTLVIGRGVQFRRRFYCEIAQQGRVAIGAGTVFAGDTMIQCTTSIDIGERAAFGQATFMADGAHKFRDYTRNMLDQGYAFRPLVIADGVMVHTKSTIVANIGKHAVIGANSLVNKDVPAYCLAGGVPARVLEYFGPPDEKPEGLGV